MFAFLGSLTFLASVAAYVYVGVAIVRMELKAKASITKAFVKAATWPVTIWDTINKLYLTKPEQ